MAATCYRPNHLALVRIAGSGSPQMPPDILATCISDHLRPSLTIWVWVKIRYPNNWMDTEHGLRSLILIHTQMYFHAIWIPSTVQIKSKRQNHGCFVDSESTKSNMPTSSPVPSSRASLSGAPSGPCRAVGLNKSNKWLMKTLAAIRRNHVRSGTISVLDQESDGNCRLFGLFTLSSSLDKIPSSKFLGFYEGRVFQQFRNSRIGDLGLNFSRCCDIWG